MKERLDKLLVQKDISRSRSKAKRLIMAGKVIVNDRMIDKAGTRVDTDADIRIKGETHPYVSRGGLKLQNALEEFEIDVEGKHCLDIGASTGGFTQCLLMEGASRVHALDVGHNQLAWKLRDDTRVEVYEDTNARYLEPGDFPVKFDLITVDVAFISLTKIIPVLEPLLKPGGEVITLVKPQFEVGKDNVGKGGIVKDYELHKEVLEDITGEMPSYALHPRDIIPSPIEGAGGNREFFIYSTLKNKESVSLTDKIRGVVYGNE